MATTSPAESGNPSAQRRPKEPAWHRRQRKQRALARLNVTLLSQRVLLAQHHGSCLPSALQETLYYLACHLYPSRSDGPAQTPAADASCRVPPNVAPSRQKRHDVQGAAAFRSSDQTNPGTFRRVSEHCCQTIESFESQRRPSDGCDAPSTNDVLEHRLLVSSTNAADFVADGEPDAASFTGIKRARSGSLKPMFGQRPRTANPFAKVSLGHVLQTGFPGHPFNDADMFGASSSTNCPRTAENQKHVSLNPYASPFIPSTSTTTPPMLGNSNARLNSLMPQGWGQQRSQLDLLLRSLSPASSPASEPHAGDGSVDMFEDDLSQPEY